MVPPGPEDFSFKELLAIDEPKKVRDEPYREMCGGCSSLQRQLVELRSELALARGEGLHPNQGADRLKHRCIFCGEMLYYKNHHGEPQTFNPNYYASEPDMLFCRTGEFVQDVKMGFWIFESTTQVLRNVGCPKETGVTHLHRYCNTCGGKWLERPINVGRAREPAPAPPPQKVPE
jgi:hypothetical protein